MKTDELVTMLAKSAIPVESNATTRRFMSSLGWGAFGTTLVMAIALGVRPDIVEAASLPMFWIKLALPLSIVIGMYHAATRLARPGVPIGHKPGATLGAMLAAVWLLAIAALFYAAPDDRNNLIFGNTWLFCLSSIPLLSIPVFLAAIWAMKGLAPTRLSLAGGVVGLLAGGTSAAVYALHCPEMGAPFLAIWYVLGMSIPAIAGAIIGPLLLRW